MTFTERLIEGTRHALTVLDSDDYSPDANARYGNAVKYLRENCEAIARTLVDHIDARESARG